MNGGGVSNGRAVRERWAHQRTEQDKHRDAVDELSARELLLLGTGLYLAEGAKSKPSRRQLSHGTDSVALS